MDREKTQGLIRAAALPLCDSGGLELVDVIVSIRGRSGLVKVVIDREGGVTSSDCEWLSQRLSLELDAVDPLPFRYLLEVSSPGLDRPLRTPEEFQRFVNRRASAVVEDAAGRRRITGLLAAADDERFVLIEPGKEPEPFLYESVVKAHLAPDLDELLGRKPGHGRRPSRRQDDPEEDDS